MTIEIHEPKLEALIHQRIASGDVRSVEGLLAQTLESAPFPVTQEGADRPGRTGLDLLEAMQPMPYKDTDIEPSRPHMQVRRVKL